MDKKIGFEGAGDGLVDRRGPWLWTGHGFRAEIEAHADIGTFFDTENAVNIDDQVILKKAADPLQARRMRAGFHVHEVELSEFFKAVGAAKCLTVKLLEPAR